MVSGCETLLKMRPDWRVVLPTALGPLLWGSTYLVTTQWLPPDRPFWAALFRSLPAGVILLAFGWHLPRRDEWLRLLVLSALHIGIFQGLLFIAAYRLPGGLAAVMGAIQPIIVLALGRVIDRVATPAAAWIAAATGIAGMAVLLLGPASRWDMVGVAAALGGALCMGIGTFLTRRWRLSTPVLALTGWQLLLGGLMLAPLALLVDPDLPALTLRNGLGYAYLCLLGSVLAYALWFRGVMLLPGAAVSALALLSPLMAVVLGWVFLGQSLGMREFIGFGMVLASVLAVQVLAPRPRSADNVQ